MRKSPEERKAALERQIAAKKQLIRRIDKRETEKARRLRNHRLIVAGALIEGIIAAEPGSPITSAFGRALESHLAQHPEDREAFADLLETLITGERREAAE